MPHTFVHETSNNQVKRFVALSVVILLLTLTIVAAAVSYARAHGKVSSESFLSRYTPDILHNITPLKQFIIAILNGIAFVPVPVPTELIFFISLKQGNPVLLSLAATILGFTIGNVIGYICGWKLSKHIVYLISTKKMYALRRKVNKYGAWAIVITNLTPAPSDLLSFSLGVAKYNVKRFLFYFIITLTVELSAIAMFFYFVH